jgi:hypothetical protein
MSIFRVVVRIAVLGLLPTFLLAGCSSPVTIQGVTASGDGTVLTLSLSSCNADLAVNFSEDEDALMILVQERGSLIALGGDDCSDLDTIVLGEPLGDRIVIDEQTGQQLVPVYEPWNQQEYSEAQYRAALEETAACIRSEDPEARVEIRDGDEGPELDVEFGDLADGERSTVDVGPCYARFLDPLRR